MRIRLEETAARVEPHEALAWWSDFREGRHDHAFLRGETRRILERDERGGAVTMVDQLRLLGVPLFTERTVARAESGAVAFEGRNTLSRFSGRYSFAVAPQGTLVRLDAEVQLNPPLRWTQPFARPIVEAILRSDLRHHARDMEEDLTRTRRR